MKELFIAGNWKMHFTREEAQELAQVLVKKAEGSPHRLMLAVPYTSLEVVSRVLRGSNISLGAQNVAWAEQGAFTGEISAKQLKDLQVEYVLIGHSERRQYFAETNESVNARLNSALQAGLKVVLCVGETLGERKDKREKSVVGKQLSEGLKDVSSSQMSCLTIAYEPVWAIGTGETASPEQAEDMHAFIREHLAEMYGETIAKGLIIQYGGSVNDKNVVQLMSKPNINGALVGGASLKADSFSAIMNVEV